MITPVAVLTISDRSSRGERADLSGPAVVQHLPPDIYTVVETRILPDERDTVSAALRELADGGRVSVILTTGGTGLSPRDVTPEATRDAMDREIPGLAEAMRQFGLKFTRFAPLSRAVAGNRGTVLIINLPGSPKGAVESLDAILDLVPHVLRQLSGQTDNEHA